MRCSIKLWGLLGLGLLIFGCGKKGDPRPLYKQPIFSTTEVKEPPSAMTNQTSEKKDSTKGNP